MSKSTPTDLSSRHPWRTAVVAGMASYLDAAAITALGSALVLFGPELGLVEADYGLASGLLTLCFAVGALIGGRLGDKFGRRRVFTVTLIVYVIGASVLAGATGPSMLFAGAALTGLAVGADLPVSLALIAEEAPAGKKGRMIAFSGFLWFLGVLVPSIAVVGLAPLGVLGARILLGHLVVVAIVVLVLRLSLRESAEWTRARELTTAEALTDVDHGEIEYSHLGQLFRRPIVITVAVLGLYYALWNLAANTVGQFNAYIWVNVAGLNLQDQAIFGLIGLPLTLIAIFIFIRVVDRPSRRLWFYFGTAITVIAFALPAVFGLSAWTLTIPLVCFGVGSAFSGEAIYKVWSQELMPTLLRSSGQGLTLALARLIAAGFAFVTPAIASGAPQVLYGLLAVCTLAAGLVGVLVVPRLPTAEQLGGPIETANMDPRQSAEDTTASRDRRA